jgi:hypothetical protein
MRSQAYQSCTQVLVLKLLSLSAKMALKTRLLAQVRAYCWKYSNLVVLESD